MSTPEKPLAFIIMPLAAATPLRGGYSPLAKDDLDTVFSMIRTALARRGYTVRRAESPGDILRDIVLDLDRADLVVADITGLNPNVMYELGIRHGFCKKTILLTQDLRELPFDIAGYQCMEYSWITEANRRKFRADLSSLLGLLDKHSDPRFGPVHTHLGTKSLAVHEERRQQELRQLAALSRELVWISTQVDMGLVVAAKHFPDELEAKIGGPIKFLSSDISSHLKATLNKVFTMPGRTPCIDAFLSNCYVEDDYDMHGEVTSLARDLRTMTNASWFEPSAGATYYLKIYRTITSAYRTFERLYTAVSLGIKGKPLNEIEPDRSLMMVALLGQDYKANHQLANVLEPRVLDSVNERTRELFAKEE